MTLTGNRYRAPSGQGVASTKRGTPGGGLAPRARARARAATTARRSRGGAPAPAAPAARVGSALSLSLAAAWFCVVLLLGSGGVGVARADDALNAKVVGAFDFAGKQLTVLNEDVLTEEGVFTDYTDEDGKWITTKEKDGEVEDIGKGVWTSGMVAGMFWYQYEATGDPAMKTAAEFYCKGLEGVEEEDDNDLGFQVLNSYGLGYRLSNSTSDQEAYLGRVLTGAETLYKERWDENIPAFWSWANPTDRREWDRAVNVDMIMNMEIMLWAKGNGGEDRDSEVEGHADSTWRDIVRSDNSTNHVANYDVEDGSFNETGTYQGWRDDSTWTRGQAWGIYGYAMVYRYIPEPRFLSRSLGLFGYWEKNLPDDLVPPADFDAPASASDNGKDSSATAIVASALLEIFVSTKDPVYLVKAQNHLSALLKENYYIPDATDGYQSILRRATAKWGEPEVGATFGDYFLLEAMLRYQKLAPSILLRQEAAIAVAASSGERRRLNADNTHEGKAGGREEVGGERRLQELAGGEFCALVVSEDGVVSFEDPECVPIPPNFSATPAPADPSAAATPSPTTASRGGALTPGPVAATEAPVTLAPLAPGDTLTPTTLSPTLQPVMTGAPMVETPAPAAGTPAPTTEQPAPVPQSDVPVVGETQTPVALSAKPKTVPPTGAPVTAAAATPSPIADTEPPTPTQTPTRAPLLTPAPAGADDTPAPAEAQTEAEAAAEADVDTDMSTPAPATADADADVDTVPTSAPTTADTDSEVDAMSTPAPTKTGDEDEVDMGSTQTPTQTIAPSGGGLEAQAAGENAVFGALTLDDDVDLSYLSTTSPIIIWFGVTLDNTSSTPAKLSLENSGGTLLSADIEAPADGWQTGSNSVSFEVPVGAFDPTAWTKVVEVTVGFAPAPAAGDGAVTEAAVDWLVITNELVL
eukprot:g9531.t2